MKLKEFIKMINDAGIDVIDDVLRCGDRTYGYLDGRKYIRFFSDGMMSDRIKIKSILELKRKDIFLNIKYDICNVFPPTMYSSFQVKGRVLNKTT